MLVSCGTASKIGQNQACIVVGVILFVVEIIMSEVIQFSSIKYFSKRYKVKKMFASLYFIRSTLYKCSLRCSRKFFAQVGIQQVQKVFGIHVMFGFKIFTVYAKGKVFGHVAGLNCF